MFRALPIQLIQDESEDLIQMINPEQESDIKPEDLPTALSIREARFQRVKNHSSDLSGFQGKVPKAKMVHY